MADKLRELQEKFWKALKSDMTMMLGLVGVEESHTLPMTAQLENDNKGPIWFFTAKDNSLAQNLKRNGPARLPPSLRKGHDLFATVHGQLDHRHLPETIDRLWNPFVAAGTRAARMTRTWCCCGLMPRRPRSG